MKIGNKINFENKPDGDICKELKKLMKNAKKEILYECYRDTDDSNDRCAQAKRDLTFSKQLFDEKNCKRYYPFVDNFSCTEALEKMYTNDQLLKKCLKGDYTCSQANIDEYVSKYEQGYSNFKNDSCFNKYKKGNNK